MISVKSKIDHFRRSDLNEKFKKHKIKNQKRTHFEEKICDLNVFSLRTWNDFCLKFYQTCFLYTLDGHESFIKTCSLHLKNITKLFKVTFILKVFLLKKWFLIKRYFFKCEIISFFSFSNPCTILQRFSTQKHLPLLGSQNPPERLLSLQICWHCSSELQLGSSRGFTGFLTPQFTIAKAASYWMLCWL